MKNKFLKAATLAVSAVCILSFLAGCGENGGGDTVKKNGDGTNFQQAFLDPVDQEKYFVGMCALRSEEHTSELQSQR